MRYAGVCILEHVVLESLSSFRLFSHFDTHLFFRFRPPHTKWSTFIDTCIPTHACIRKRNFVYASIAYLH